MIDITSQGNLIKLAKQLLNRDRPRAILEIDVLGSHTLRGTHTGIDGIV